MLSAELVSSAFDISISRFGFFGVNYTDIVVIFHYTLLLFDLVCVKDEYQLTLLVSLIVAKPVHKHTSCKVKALIGSLFQLVPRENYVIAVNQQIFHS